MTDISACRAICACALHHLQLTRLLLEPCDCHAGVQGGADYVEVDSKGEIKEATEDERALEAIGWKELRRSAPFWLMVLGFVAMGIVNGCILTNQVSNMTSITVNGVEIVTGGHSAEWASIVLSGQRA